jgi:NADPH:quinone reductase-like Zn-dependent oxidoreductase
MKAIVQERYGSADVLELKDIDQPEMGGDEVLVRVLAASAHIISGELSAPAGHS